MFIKPVTDSRELDLATTSSPASSRDYDHSAMQRSGPSSPHDYSIDPAIGGSSGIMSTSNDSGGDDNSGDGRKGYGKRELSTSKRAAQNRAAQVCDSCFFSPIHIVSFLV